MNLKNFIFLITLLGFLPLNISVANDESDAHPNIKIKETDSTTKAETTTKTVPNHPRAKKKLKKQPSTDPEKTTPTNPEGDNTKVNQRDRNTDEVTADQQKMDSADTTLTAKIRRELMKDSSLSSYAHNVKIISQYGHVTLKGPVKTASEKNLIEEKAQQVAGNNVHSELEIVP